MILGSAIHMYLSVAKRLREAFATDEEGQGMIEYALLVALIALVVIVALVALGPQIATEFNNITSNL